MAKKKEESDFMQAINELVEKNKTMPLSPSFYEESLHDRFWRFTIEKPEVELLLQFILDALNAKVESNFSYDAYNTAMKMVDFLEDGKELAERWDKIHDERLKENEKREKLAKKKKPAPKKKVANKN